jgi:hypothetical protein
LRFHNSRSVAPSNPRRDFLFNFTESRFRQMIVTKARFQSPDHADSLLSMLPIHCLTGD